MKAERRQKRSNRRLEALRLYVETLAHRYRVQALALASHEGFLLAGVGEGYDLDELAILGAVGADEPARVAPLFDSYAPGAHFATAQLSVEHTPFYLAMVGGTLPVAGALPGDIGRILSMPPPQEL